MNELVHRLLAQGDDLAAEVHTAMLADPFWLARYGERARTHMRQDNAFHLQYLCEALVGDPAAIDRYARWLRDLLTTRGMCSAHIADNFRRLGAAIAARWTDAGPALEMLERGVAALSYPPGPAAALQQAGPGIAALAASRCGATPAALEMLTSYLADAMAQAAPERFAAHAVWLAGWQQREPGAGPPVAGQLAALSAAIDELAPTASRDAGAVLAIARPAV